MSTSDEARPDSAIAFGREAHPSPRWGADESRSDRGEEARPNEDDPGAPPHPPSAALGTTSPRRGEGFGSRGTDGAGRPDDAMASGHDAYPSPLWGEDESRGDRGEGARPNEDDPGAPPHPPSAALGTTSPHRGEGFGSLGANERARPDPALERVAARYAVAITPALAALIDPADPHDPIARQFQPSLAELETRPEELADPIGDAVHAPLPGLVHRYPDRVLFKPVHVCAVYCRFCFRREMVGPGSEATLSDEAIAQALGYIAAHPEIWEVILSGGDPLVLSPRRLARIGAALARIDHVKVVRVHTRLPAAAPDRITDALVGALKSAGKASWVVLHANHPRELTPAARAACARLIEAGIPMLSQSVLLAGVNDDPATLEALMRALVETRIKPYYLHHGDLAPGTSHFRTTIPQGQALLRGLRGRVSGLCQPAYMLDIPGGHGKAPIGPCYLAEAEGGHIVEDWRGSSHVYAPGEAEPSGS